MLQLGLVWESGQGSEREAARLSPAWNPKQVPSLTLRPPSEGRGFGVRGLQAGCFLGCLRRGRGYSGVQENPPGDSERPSPDPGLGSHSPNTQCPSPRGQLAAPGLALPSSRPEWAVSAVRAASQAVSWGQPQSLPPSPSLAAQPSRAPIAAGPCVACAGRPSPRGP